MSSDPNVKVASARVPEVSDKYVNQRISRWWVFSYGFYLVVVLTLLVGGITWGAPIVLGKVKSFENTFMNHNAVLPTLTPNPDVQPDCLKQVPQSPDPDKKPVLFFCSPRYLGDVGGPFGTQIILVGANFSSPPTGWFLPTRPVALDDTLTACSSNTQTDCQSLSGPSSEKQVQGVFLFSWVWQAPSFPSTPGDYFITAHVGDQFVTTIPKRFTLKTSQPPCITISAVDSSAHIGGPSDCSPKPNQVALKPGTPSIEIDGINWLLGWKSDDTDLHMQVEVVATCVSSCQGQNPLFDVTATRNALSPTGTFSLYQTLPPDVGGRYTVRAWNEILVEGSLGGNTSTIVNDHALTFGEGKNDLILNIA